MKKLIALLLCVTLALSAVCTASADMCYEILKRYFQDEGQGCNLGTPVTATLDGSSEKHCIIAYNSDNKTVTLVGDNISGVYEGTMWSDVEQNMGLLAIVSVCGAWESLSATLEADYTLYAGLISGEDSIYISTAQEATLLMQMLGSAQAE